jgi:biopolymer transport protein TolQ
MTSLFSGNPLIDILKQADTISRLTLISLLVMSIVCWTITLYKAALLHVRIKSGSQLLARLRIARTQEELFALEHAAFGSPAHHLLKRGVLILRDLCAVQQPRCALDAREEDLLDGVLDQGYHDAMREQDEYMAVLSTSAAASPLIGLFGTVWGLIHAFVRISERQSADITTVAPGIAEALITTLAGLVVAIPALVMYHVLQTKIKVVEYQLLAIADEFSLAVKKLFR